MAQQSAQNEKEKFTEDIVISGMSGQFPASSNIDEFEYNLYNKIDMVDDKETRFQHTNPMIPRLSGKIKNVSSFDNEFFGISKAMANSMDPQGRYLLEEALKAILDAGINPKTLYGTKTGVYIGSSVNETEELMYSNTKDFLFGIAGKSNFASRISYYLGVTGPALACDTACSSSMYAFDLALKALKSGEIDAAIVGGANLCLHVNIFLQFALLGVLSASGRCRPFDREANGYCRSEAIGCLFLQKSKDAKRIYATVLGSKTNCDGFKVEGITYPSSVIQEKLLKEIYAQENIDVNDLGFLEAHSTATIAGDPEECKAIDNVIARKRSTPLPIGSVKSNCGHSEPAAGVCSIVKVLLAMNKGVIAPNINLKSIKETIEGLRSGRLAVVTEPTKLEKAIVGVNSFGFGGANAHAILRQFDKPKALSELYQFAGNKLPRLVVWSARTEAGVEAFFKDLEKQALDFELLALAHNIQKDGVKGFTSRGYAVLQPTSESAPPLLVEKKLLTPKKSNRKVAWIFSGIGSHWNNMGRSLMQLDLFQQTITKLQETLQPLGLDLRKIIETPSRRTLENVLAAFVGVTAVQLALIDVLKALAIEADFFVGQSIGELACAYADGSLTAEQAILVSYLCGSVTMKKVQAKGAVVLVKAKLADVAAICPETVTVTAALTTTTCIISGPKADVIGFVNSLKASDIYTEKLEDVDIAYHSKPLAEAAADLTQHLQKVVPKPKLRSNRWISTSVLAKDWLDSSKQYASAEYFVNNLQSPVLFEQVLPFVPKDALVIDFGPPVFQRSIWEKKQTFADYVKLIPAEPRSDLNQFLSAIGCLYLNGINVDIERLYPKVEFPVSRGTRCLSPLIELDHSENCLTYHCEKQLEGSGAKTFTVSAQQYEWLMGHEIDGRVLLPATFYLECVWRTLSGIHSRVDFESLAVEFNSIKFERATTFSADSTIELLVVIHFDSGRFEITESNSLVASGFVKPIKPSEPIRVASDETTSKSATMIAQQDFYKELKLRGYHYKGDFRSVVESNIVGSKAQLKWTNNWTTFMDCMLQIGIIGQDSRTLLLPTRIRRLRIYPSYHLSKNPKHSNVSVYANSLRKQIVAGGIEIIGLDASAVSRRRSPAEPVLEAYQFLPHFPAPKLSLENIARCCVQIVLENQPRQHLQLVELAQSKDVEQTFLNLLAEAVSDLPLITGNYTLVYDLPKPQPLEASSHDGINYLYADDELELLKPNILVLPSFSRCKNLAANFMENLDNKEFLISRECASLLLERFVKPKNYEIAAYFPGEKETFVLLRKTSCEQAESVPKIFDISTSSLDFDWIEPLQQLCREDSNVVVLAQSDRLNGILGLTNCLRKEPETKHLRCVFIDDENCPAFELKNPLFSNQLQKTLAINVYKERCWGTYRHLKLKEEQSVAPYRGHAFGHMSQVGDLNSLKWFQGPLSDETADVKIVYSSLNFRDVMQASGRLPIAVFGKGRLNQACIFGFEYSGVDATTGKRIMGMTTKGAVGTHLQDTALFQFDVPKKWSLQEAASVPVVYVTIYYAFFYVADIRKGKSILIHAGSGGVGLAAIRVAQAYGLEVYTTVGSKEKRDFLLKTYPKLKASNIGNSRDNSFEQMIMQQTAGKGVDFVLNSLSEDKLKTSLRCLSKHGHFIEIGKYDMAADNTIEMNSFMNGVTFSSVLADQLLQADKCLIQSIKQHMIADMEKGIIAPLPVTVFEASKIVEAFRYLMSGKHVGKVVLQVRKDETAKETLPIAVTCQSYFEGDKVYVIPGGLGGFGLELVDWMIIRGARKIVLSSSRGVTSDYQKLRISLWQSYGCEIVVNTADIGSLDGCQALLTEALKLGAVGGIFNLAVVLKDSVFQNQTKAQFQASFKPKAFATKHLDQLSRQLCPELRHFVIFSSVSCGRGNAGQSNYGMANSIMERIIEDRVANGLPGKAVQWGAVGEVGLVADMAAGKIDLEIGGTLQQRISSCLQVLDVLLTSSEPIVASMVVAEKKASSSGRTPIEFVLNTLSIRDIKTISMTAKLSELGLDSLTSVEIRQTFERDYGIVLNTADLRSLTIEKLAEFSEKATPTRTAVTSNATEGTTVQYIDHLRQFYGQITELLNVKGKLEKICFASNKRNCTPILVLPGIDGSGGKIWSKIGENLKSPAYVVKYHELSEATTLEDVVEFCFENIIKCMRYHNSNTFKIIGYSMGSLLTHKVVAMLESLGFQGKVIYIDGSPDYIQNLISSLQRVYKGIELEKMAMSVMLSLVLPTLDLQTIVRDIRLKVNKEEISVYIYDQLMAHNYPKTNDLLSKIEGICQRLKLIQLPDTYTNIETIDSELLLLKPTEITMTDFDENYGLSLFTRSQVKTAILDGNHQTILHNERLPSIINKFFMF